METQFFQLLRENPIGTLVVVLALIWAVERMVVAFLNRNKPSVNCACYDEDDDCDEECEEEEEDDEDEEVIASGRLREKHEDK